MKKKNIIQTIKIIGVVIMMGIFSTGHAKGNFQITGIHKAIASEDVWLNTERSLTAEDLKGRIILLDFWTFCCINCIHVIPELQELEDEFGHDLTVIGVHSAKFANERETTNIKEAIIRYGIQHPVVNDNKFGIWQAFGVRAWPTLVLISPRGQVAGVYSGEGNGKQIRADIIELKEQFKENFVKEPLPIKLEHATEPNTLLQYPGKFESSNNGFYIADSSNNRIIEVDETGKILQQIGSGKKGYQDGDLSTAQFNTPQGLLYDQDNNLLYVADTNNHVIRRVDLGSQKVETIAGIGEKGYERRTENAPARKTAMASPWDITFYPNKQHIAIAMAGTHQLWTYDIENETVSVLAGNGREYIDDGRYPLNSLSQPSGLAAWDNKLYFVDAETSSLRVLEKGAISTLIGTGLFDFGFKDGIGLNAQLQHPLGIYADETGIYIADSYNHAIRHYNPETQELTTIAGSGEAGEASVTTEATQFNEPNDLLRIDEALYVLDTNNHTIQRVVGSKVDQLFIRQEEAMHANNKQPLDFLPNNNSLPEEQVLAHKSIEIEVEMHKAWKINEKAPSFMTLFKKHKDEYLLVKEWQTDTIKTQLVNLPKLDDDQEYRLQASFYYCKKNLESICLIQSVDQLLKTKEDGVDSIKYTLKTLSE